MADARPHFFLKKGLTKIRYYGVMLNVRHEGTQYGAAAGRRPSSAGAAGGKKYPANYARQRQKGVPLVRLILSYFELF
jgi:hypothetical protein